MSLEANKAVVTRYFEGDHDGRDNIAVWAEICAPAMTVTAPIFPEPIRGLEAVTGFTAAMHSAFSDLALHVDEMVAEDDRVAARWTMSGVHTGPLALPGAVVPATGNRISVTGTSVCRLAGGKLVEEQVQGDWLGMMQQLGLIPSA